ncbi:MAG TPA: c-type cytochrome biogenesis protein CcsB, partial [Nitrospirota bacterium]
MVNIFFFKAALGAYFLGMASFLYFLISRKERPPRLSFALTGLGFLIHTVALIVRTAEATYIPITNLHEAMSFFSWALVLAFLLIEYRYRIYILGSFVLPVTFISLISSATLPMEIKML